MPVRDVFKISRKTFFNPTGWLGYELIKSQFRATWGIIKGLFIPEKPAREETFEQALVRLNLTEDAIQETAKTYQLYALIFLVLGACSFSYSFYLLFYHGSFAGWLLALSVTALLLTQALRFDFWRFQIKHRKLGCTLQEWWHGKVNNQEGPSA